MRVRIQFGQGPKVTHNKSAREILAYPFVNAFRNIARRVNWKPASQPMIFNDVPDCLNLLVQRLHRARGDLRSEVMTVAALRVELRRMEDSNPGRQAYALAYAISHVDVAAETRNDLVVRFSQVSQYADRHDRELVLNAMQRIELSTAFSGEDGQQFRAIRQNLYAQQHPIKALLQSRVAAVFAGFSARRLNAGSLTL